MHKYFDKKFSEYLLEKHPNSLDEPRVHLKTKFHKSNTSNYYDFLDNYLFDFGIVSISYDNPCLDSKNLYNPYIKVQERNIFQIESGTIELSNTPLSLKASQETLANYLISKLNFIKPIKFQNWNTYYN